jgi:ecotin
MKRIVILSLVWVAIFDLARAADYMKAFPPATEGMTRYVLQLPATTNEDNLKVELNIGKTVQVDAQNRYFFGGALETKIAQGWGFSYYVVPELGPMAGTLRAIDANEPKVDRFVTIRGEPFLVRYNSKLPIVVYVPNGVEVRYRLWRADPDMFNVNPG